MVYVYLYIFLLSLILGSFFNVIGLRVPKGESIVAPRSACLNCKRQLTSLELIPVFSFIIQGGKCRKCKSPISPLYPIVELMTAILITISPLILGWSMELLVCWTMISMLMILFVSDITFMLIPNKVLLFFTVVFVIERIFLPLTPWWDAIIGALIAFCLLSLISIISRGGIGGGDIKLFSLLGVVLGSKGVLLAFFCSTLFGALYGLLGMLLSRLNRKIPIPFVPFILLGTIISYYFSEIIISWYVNKMIVI
ncbi:prepilin peptidase [Bacillus sp. SCS-151]|uniref:prepilin peptidase n=1 Tax=Nanhaiella sioensis TaxID=3115293 RepID=UPI003978ABF4